VIAAGFHPFVRLTARELVRFVRQPSRIVATLGTPVLLWLLLGSGFAGSFAPPSGHAATTYAAFLLPGVLTVSVMFTAILGAISLIDDRHAGFLQSVLVSPAPRWVAWGSKLAGAAAVATAQAALLLPAAAILGLPAGAIGYLGALAALACIAAGVAGLGLALAWRVDSVQGFHGVMNLLLMPMWLLSGSIFPLEGASGWLRVVMLANPMTWPTRALHASLAGAFDPIAWGATILFAAAGIALAASTIGSRR